MADGIKTVPAMGRARIDAGFGDFKTRKKPTKRPRQRPSCGDDSWEGAPVGAIVTTIMAGVFGARRPADAAKRCRGRKETAPAIR
ncbi:hypothetical protein GCM10023339_10340 [Alloalcanivorax gelatiniphagus]